MAEMDIETGKLTTLLADSKEVEELKNRFLKKAMEDHKIIYVTVNKPYQRKTEELRDNGFDPDEILFIDCVGSISEGLRAENVAYVNAKSLTNISIRISEYKENIGDEKIYLVLDTVTGLSLYNSENSVTKFIHSLASKMSSWDMKGVLVMTRETCSEKFSSSIGQFTDRNILV